jgi:hypothetical protein
MKKNSWESVYPLINLEPLEHQLTIDAENNTHKKDMMIRWCFKTFGKKRFRYHKIEVENDFEADIVLDDDNNNLSFQIGPLVNMSRKTYLSTLLINGIYFGVPEYKITIYIFSFKRKEDMMLFKMRW